MTLEDALYGLRNLSVGDDEQTRIDDEELIQGLPLELSKTVMGLVIEGKYEAAYEAAILPTLKQYTRDQIVTAADKWAREFCNEDGDESNEDEAIDLLWDMMGVYDELMGRKR